VLVTLGVSLVTGLGFGLLPALQATGKRLTRSLREGGRGSGQGRGSHRVRATLVIAATGVFGVMSYAVAQRSREISIRMALGARAGQVLRMIVGRAIALAAAGAVLGIAASVAAGRVIQNQLFGVGILDPVTLGVVVAVLIGSAAAASFLPARRAAALDPATALRES